jgi:hypothetical protein
LHGLGSGALAQEGGIALVEPPMASSTRDAFSIDGNIQLACDLGNGSIRLCCEPHHLTLELQGKSAIITLAQKTVFQGLRQSLSECPLN